MYSKTSIAQLALDRTGGEEIEDINDAHPHAALCRRWYDHARRQVLAIQDWSFARRIETLTLSDFDPPSDYSFNYLLPADCLAARRIYNPTLWASAGGDYDTLCRSPRVPFLIHVASDGLTKTLSTNMDEARLVYTCDLEAADLFPTEYVTNLAYLLGHFIGYKVSGKGTVADKMLQLYMQFAMPLMGVDANQGEDQQSQDSGITRARD